MKIEIKLDDPKFCGGCILYDQQGIITRCKLGYWDSCILMDGSATRPQECIDKHGENNIGWPYPL